MHYRPGQVAPKGVQQFCFGQLAVDVTTRIATATADELDAIAERLLTAKSPEEALR